MAVDSLVRKAIGNVPVKIVDANMEKTGNEIIFRLSPVSCRMTGRVQLTILLAAIFAPVSVNAVWDYSLAAKAALYDAVTSACRTIDPNGAKEAIDKFERTLSADERRDLTGVRRSAEYKKVFDDAVKEAHVRVTGNAEAKHKACSVLLER